MSRPRVKGIIGSLFDYMAIISFIAMTICVVLQVLFRYVLRICVPWTEEIARYFTVCLALLGGVSVTRTNQHLGAFFLRDKAKGHVKTAMNLATCLVSLTFLVVMVIGGIEQIKLNWNVRAVTVPFARVGYLFLALILGSLGMIAYLLRDVWAAIRSTAGRQSQSESGNIR